MATKTKKKEEKIIEKEIVEKPFKEEKTKKIRKKIDKNMEVKVVNLCQNTFYWIDRTTQIPLEWNSYGDFDYLTIEQVRRMKSESPKYLTDFWVLISEVEDDEVELEDVLKYLQLDSYYKEFETIKEMDEIILNSDVIKFEKVLSNLDISLKNKIADRSVQLFREKRFSDSIKMDMIESAISKDNLFNNVKKSMK